MSTSVTVTLPDGRKITSYSRRRYIAVWVRKARPIVQQRSDRLFILQTAHGGRYVWDPGYVIMDTVTGEAIPGTVQGNPTQPPDPINPACQEDMS